MSEVILKVKQEFKDDVTIVLNLPDICDPESKDGIIISTFLLMFGFLPEKGHLYRLTIEEDPNGEFIMIDEHIYPTEYIISGVSINKEDCFFQPCKTLIERLDIQEDTTYNAYCDLIIDAEELEKYKEK